MSEGDDPRDGDDGTRDGSAADDSPDEQQDGEPSDERQSSGGPSGDESQADEGDNGDSTPDGVRADAATQKDIDELRRELDELEENVDERTVHRESIEGDLKQYVRWRVRRGHATGWGPYLVLLYGTVMTLGAFVFLNGVWANLAMIVIWLSTLGLYVLMIIVGITITALRVPRGLVNKLREFR